MTAVTPRQALTRALELFDKALPKFNYGASALDAEAIRLLNEVPGEVRAALKELDAEPARPTVELVREFHEAFGHPVAEAPTPGTKKLRELRVKLIAEELTELCDALGVELEIIRSAQDGEWRVRVEATAEDDAVDLVEAADALGDLDYVVSGANLVFGFPAVAVIREIHRANMSKLGEDGKPIYREDGKVLKGPNYTPPNVRAVLGL